MGIYCMEVYCEQVESHTGILLRNCVLKAGMI